MTRMAHWNVVFVYTDAGTLDGCAEEGSTGIPEVYTGVLEGFPVWAIRNSCQISLQPEVKGSCHRTRMLVESNS